MPKSDRAFRALARAQPQIIVGLLDVVAPGVLRPGAVLAPDDAAPTQIDALPPELDADFATRVGASELLHMECQGYRDAGFESRALWYHVGFALRHRNRRRVETVALWLAPLPKGQPRDRMRHDNITVAVTTVVLHERSAADLLANPITACFAAGARRGNLTTPELCAKVAAALRSRNATWAERHMAVVAAAMRGRYDAMVSAMENANLEPVVIEDLVKLGEDRGMRKGMREGKQQGLKEGKQQGLKEGKQQGLQEGKQQGRLSEERDVVRRVLTLRKLPLTPEQQQRIDTCDDLETLRRWLDQAIFADSAAAALR